MNNASQRSELLSNREVEVIKLIAHEMTTKQIANQLYLSTETIKSHRKNILSKLNVKNVAGAVRVAYQKHILSLDEKFSHTI